MLKEEKEKEWSVPGAEKMNWRYKEKEEENGSLVEVRSKEERKERNLELAVSSCSELSSAVEKEFLMTQLLVVLAGQHSTEIPVI